MIQTLGRRSVPSAMLAGPDRFDRLLGVGAMVLLAAVILAVARGYGQWSAVGWQVWVHLATIAIALALTPVILWRRRGDPQHRQLGYVWVAALALTAALSFDIRLINRGSFSPIHLLSVFTLVMLVRAVIAARQGELHRHRRAVRLMAAGALLVAGFFTFPFNRLLGHWLFS